MGALRCAHPLSLTIQFRTPEHAGLDSERRKPPEGGFRFWECGSSLHNESGVWEDRVRPSHVLRSYRTRESGLSPSRCSPASPLDSCHTLVSLVSM